ncbi:hypothetical protein [Larkinella soli]|uniref:hypothetical protein n=1 Tax=Larkinella soli TaxID=1770527 RepID=UPI000FFCBF76|nr:hypothetical protein [Larkinella soli]
MVTSPTNYPTTAWGGRLERLTPVLIAVPLLCFAALVFTYAVDVPWFDDLESFVGFLLLYLKSDSFGEKVALLLKPNNEHRILFAKLTTVGFYHLTGDLNFRWLIGVAFLCLMGTVAILYRVFHWFRLPPLYFVPVLLIFLQPEYSGTSLWAITGLQHGAAVFLMLSALYLLSGDTAGRFGGGVACQLLASFSMSSGLFGWVAGAAVLVLQKNYRRLAIWLGVGAVAVWFYFYDYAGPQGNESSFSFFLQHPHLVFLGFFTFIGGFFNLFPDIEVFRRSILPTLFGFVIAFGVVVYVLPMVFDLIRFRYRPPARQLRTQYFLIGCYALLFVNASAVAFLRPRFGYDVMLVSNYLIYPALLTALLYLTLISQSRTQPIRWRWLVVGLLVGGFVWAWAYGFHWPRLAERKQIMLVQAFNQKHNGVGLGATPGTAFADTARAMMDQSVATGIYRYPDSFYSPFEADLLRKSRPADPKLKLSVTESAGSYRIESPDWYLPDGVRNVCLIAQSDRQTYLFSSQAPFVPRRFYGLGGRIVGVQTWVLKELLPKGTYRLGMLAVPGAGPAIRFSQQTLTVH